MAIDEPQMTLIIKRNLNLDRAWKHWLYEKCFSHSVEMLECNADDSCIDIGEVDIRVEYVLNYGTRALVFIENKINAPPTYEQFERYRRRVNRERTNGKFAEVAACLIAPSRYFDKFHNLRDHFDVLIEYESMRSLPFDVSDRSCLEEAIEKGKVAIPPDPERSQWKSRYFEIAKEVWPSARPASRMLQPTGVKMTYRLPRQNPPFYELDIEHHVWDEQDLRDYNTIRLKTNIRNNADARAQFSRTIQEHKRDDLRIWPAPKTRIYVYTEAHVPHVEMSRTPDEQREAIQECARLAMSLYDWFRSLPDFGLEARPFIANRRRGIVTRSVVAA